MGRWQERIQTRAASHEDIADGLIALGDAVVNKSNIRMNSATATYQRYSGRFHERHSDLISGHERKLCHSAPDHGAAILIDIYAEQLQHVVPHTPYGHTPNPSAPFTDADSDALSKLALTSGALHHAAHHLRAAQKLHGQRYRKKAEPLLDEIGEHIATLRTALKRVAKDITPDDSLRSQTETLLVAHCRGLLRVMETYHAHTTEMLPSPQSRPQGR